MKLLLLQLAGGLHFAILSASALVPFVLDWRTTLAPLPTLVRQLFWVYGAFIVLTIVAFGTLTLAFAPAIAVGEPLARGLSAFIALFWVARLFVGLFVFDLKPYTATFWPRLGEGALMLTFTFFVLIYGAAALWPGEVRL